MKHRIQLILPHRLFIEGLIRLLDEKFEITSENPELALIDVSLLRENIVSPDVKIIVLGGELPDLSLMVSLGVQGYVRGSVGCNTLVSIIELVLADHAVWPNDLLRSLYTQPFRPKVVEPIIVADSTPKLSPKELLLVDMLRYGHSNKMIARSTNITEATVKVHIKAIIRKLRVTNRTQAAVWASVNVKTLESNRHDCAQSDLGGLGPLPTIPTEPELPGWDRPGYVDGAQAGM